MQMFKVDGMTCGHCERTVTQAVHGVDPAAAVKVDLAAGTVGVESKLPADRLAQAIVSEGYPARPLG